MSSLPLVNEIEARIGYVQSPADVHAAITRKYIRESPYWPRIRAALLAGEEMATFCENAVPTSYAGEAAIRFRAATEGTK